MAELTRQKDSFALALDESTPISPSFRFSRLLMSVVDVVLVDGSEPFWNSADRVQILSRLSSPTSFSSSSNIHIHALVDQEAPGHTTVFFFKFSGRTH